MYFSFVASALASFLAASSLAAPNPAAYVVHEKRDEPSRQWNKLKRANPRDRLPIRIGLVQQNLQNAEQYLMDVSDPRSPNFGQHWSAEKVANTFSATPEAIEKVTSWLTDSGISIDRLSYAPGGNRIDLNASISEAQTLFRADYWVYQHVRIRSRRIDCDEYHLPRDVRNFVDLIVANKEFRRPGLGHRNQQYVNPGRLVPRNSLNRLAFVKQTGLSELEQCYELITIECLRAIYNFSSGTLSDSSNKMGIISLEDSLYREDLNQFFRNYTSPPIPVDTVPEFYGIEGGDYADTTVAEEKDAWESAIDFQTAYSIIHPQNLRLYQLGNTKSDLETRTFDAFFDALDELHCAYEDDKRPGVNHVEFDPASSANGSRIGCHRVPKSNVLSISYGDFEGYYPEDYHRHQCNEFMKLALQGVSVFIASDNYGVTNRFDNQTDSDCIHDNDLYGDINDKAFSVDSPSHCPYVTAVGATDLLTDDIFGGEKAAALRKPHLAKEYASGGGFSNVFEIPSYQKEAVSNYMTTYPPPYDAHKFNSTGTSRAYPDVSALGLNIAGVSAIPRRRRRLRISQQIHTQRPVDSSTVVFLLALPAILFF